jgi:hypothetical protein
MKKIGERRKMPIAKLKEATIALVMAAFILMAAAGLSIPPVSAASGSIARVNYYPRDQGTYESVNYFLMQITAVNTNTTVSASIDGGLPIPLSFQGSKSAMVSGDTVPCDWYTWQTTVPAITAPGRHKFQFFSHYYVWQEPDKYWAEFNAYSDIHSFIVDYPSGLSPSPDPTSSKSTLPPIAAPSEGAIFGIIVSSIVALAASATLQRRYLARKTKNKP